MRCLWRSLSGSPGRLVDLGLRVTHPLVFLPGTKGSSSIKKVLPAVLSASGLLQARYGAPPVYGAAGGIPSLNFRDQIWVRFDEQGRVCDPYSLLAGRFNDAELDVLEDAEENSSAVASGGAAMVAYSLLQSDLLDIAARDELTRQLLRYCELDTLAMVMLFEGLQVHATASV